MRRAITHFMWGYQPHFRSSLESRARQLLDALGADVRVEALLVGVRGPDVEDGFAVCVEPEDGVWDLDLFSGCLLRSQEIYADHPDQSIFYGDEPSMRDKPERIRRKAVRQAVEEALGPYDGANGVRSFCGLPARIGDYHVVPVLQVDAAEFDALPALPSPIHFMDWTSRTGMAESVVIEVLDEATDALGAREPGRFLDEFPADPPAVLREAARHLCSAISLFLGDFMLQGLFDALNKASELKYEGGETRGEVVFAPRGSEAVDCQVTFADPVPLRTARLVRKIIETSGDGLACFCSGSDGLVGLASIDFSPATPVFRVVFIGHYCWELYFNDCLLLKCTFGVPEIPRPRLTEEQFASNCRRIMTGMTAVQSHRLWQAVSSAMEQRHGTMLVVSDAARVEAERLGRQSLRIAPMELTALHVARLSGIDGAILVDRDSVCYAVGVILDGLATNAGDPARGARYNSAVRYAATASAPTLCIVVSEDGYVDMIPTLRPQVSRRELESNVDALSRLTAEDFHAVRNWLDHNRFYLSPEQCEMVNRELARIDSELVEIGSIRVILPPFEPNEGMDDTYFLEED